VWLYSETSSQTEEGEGRRKRERGRIRKEEEEEEEEEEEDEEEEAAQRRNTILYWNIGMLFRNLFIDNFNSLYLQPL
jgi:hypothetical protein